MPASTSTADIQVELSRRGDPEKAEFVRRYFKAGPGQHGAGDLFRGIRVPVLRKLAVQYQNISISEAGDLLRSSFHEDRLLALFILIRIYARGDKDDRGRIYRLYLKKIKFINNWDLVDASAGHIVGAFLLDKSREPLYSLAVSGNLWERRIAVMATFHYIKRCEFSDTLRIARMLLGDKEDLIHKAVGWMLREVGKRDMDAEREFLDAHYARMPRVMLRYAIERFPEHERRRYLRA